MIVAFLGAGGTMGLPMARNIKGAGIDVRAWNRTRDKAEPLAGDGIEIASTPAEAADGADVILTMLSDADAVLEVAEQALEGAGDSVTWLQMSTIGIAGTERCVELAENRGIELVDAPVLGTKQPAEQAELVILGSGPEAARERLKAIFDAVGKKLMWLGDAGKGSALKVVVNAWIVAVVEGAAETIALAEGIGVDPKDFLDAIDGGPLDLPYLKLKAKLMLEREFTPSFRLELAAKDAALVREAAERDGLELPVLEAIRERMEQAVPEHGDEDLAATFLTSAPD
ncbi:MAG: NAD(P)-dependent oxidoreductase [Thermoleophilaceae bacterium]